MHNTANYFPPCPVEMSEESDGVWGRLWHLGWGGELGPLFSIGRSAWEDGQVVLKMLLKQGSAQDVKEDSSKSSVLLNS